MKICNPICISIIHILCFISADVLTQIIFSGFDARSAYGTINAWWFCLYVGALIGVSLRSLLYTALIIFIILVTLFTTEMINIFDHNAPSILSQPISFIFLIFAQSIFITSPILINIAINKVIKKQLQNNDSTVLTFLLCIRLRKNGH